MANPRAAEILAAWQAGLPMPIVDPQRSMDLAAAYALQHEYVQLRLAAGDHIGGFKAALTAPQARAGFAASEAAFSVLFASGARASHARVGLSAFVRLVLETEIGYRFAAPLDQLPAADALPGLVAEVLPVIELADLGAADPRTVSLTDLISCNVASAQFVVGQAHARPTDINALTLRFERDGDELHTGSARDGFGDQWQALAWLVQRVLAAGYRIEPQHLLITGALGRVQPGLAGLYRGTYAGLGEVHLALR